jgi:hypothetical protein
MRRKLCKLIECNAVPSVTAAALLAHHSPVSHSHTSPEKEITQKVMAMTKLS